MGDVVSLRPEFTGPSLFAGDTVVVELDATPDFSNPARSEYVVKAEDIDRGEMPPVMVPNALMAPGKYWMRAQYGRDGKLSDWSAPVEVDV
jgi:hypothetical protein